MTTPEEVRTYIVGRLHHDLVGPMDPAVPDEILSDYPTDKYLTGILFPRQSAIPQEDDDEIANGNGGEDDDAREEAVPLSQCIRPASAGLSFIIRRTAGAGPVEFTAIISAARYQKKWIAEDGTTLTDEARPGKEKVRWQRVPPGEGLLRLRIDDNRPRTILLNELGFEGLELYLQSAGIGTDVTTTAVLINNRNSEDDRDTNEQNTWFQTGVTIKPLDGCVLVGRKAGGGSFSKDDQAAELIYRDALEYAQGHSCSAMWEKGVGGVVEFVRTAWLPSAVVNATSKAGDPVFDSLRTSAALRPFSATWLSNASKNDLAAALKLIPEAYDRWVLAQQARISDLSPRLKPFAGYHDRMWVDGSRRMLSGISRLENDQVALRSFQLANRAIALQRRWARSEADLVWYPFQLAFLLLVLESVLDPSHEDRDMMDLLWFPTGGGKTEAYLAVIAMLLFYRRLSLKKGSEGAGVNVIMRYTLRVLTTQQFERAANLICACEYLRASEHLDSGNTPFSIGLWIGSAAIPNTVKEARQDVEQRAMQIRECPCCHSKVALGADATRYDVFCQNKDCFFGKGAGPLPIWTVDEDIYRTLPSLLIGTVDKFAQIARKQETGRLFGRATPYRPPDLIIQDELHLISGPLGTLAGLYETAVDVFCAQNGYPVKVIGSTATIKMAGNQVKDLFNRRLYQFPPPGIDSGNSCFAVRDDSRPGRLYLGITTAGRSAKFTLQAVSASLMQAASSPLIPPDQRDDYWTLVTYFNSLRELGGAHVLMLDDVPKSMSEYGKRRDEAPRILSEPAELTSRLSQAEIPEALRRLSETQSGGRAEDVLLCTNMISVGVDVPRLALMIVNGQPKSVAEYIQATSRVGRDLAPGLIVAVFNSNKPRDRSRYETFTNWHQTLYRDVEPTSVTPFAARALDKALRAVIAALVRHIIPAMGANPVLGPDRREEVEELAGVFIERARQIDPSEKDEVRRRINVILDEWEKREGVRYYWNEYRPQETLMMSAERVAARRAANRPELNIWSAPNSMRDVEPESQFRLIG
jgi:Helicase conserved C-terminal domain